MRNDFKVSGRTFTVTRDCDTVSISVDGHKVRCLPHLSASEAIECENWAKYVLIEVEAVERRDPVRVAASELVRLFTPLAAMAQHGFTLEQRDAFFALARALEKA